MKILCILLLIQLPMAAFALNTPMGNGADMGISSNTYINVGGDGVNQFAIATNWGRGSLVIIAKGNGSGISRALGYYGVVCASKEGVDLQTHVVGFTEQGWGSQFYRKSGDQFWIYHYFPQWNNGTGPGITNEWHIWVFAADSVTNRCWLDGVESISNRISHRDAPYTDPWFDAANRVHGLGASQKKRTFVYTDGHHFDGVLETVISYPYVLSDAQIERITNTRGRWLPRSDIYAGWTGMRNFGYGTELTNGTSNVMHKMTTEFKNPIRQITYATNKFTGVIAADSYRRRRRRQ